MTGVTISVFVLFIRSFSSNNRVTLRHWRRGGDTKLRCVSAVGHEDAKKSAESTHIVGERGER